MLVLASASPRRRALLEEAGIRFKLVAPSAGERMPERGDPHAVAVANARAKALSVSEEGPVLGADTVVAVGDRLLGKPEDDQGAVAILKMLSGTRHSVVTGVALAFRGEVRTRSVETFVTMRELGNEEIEAYVASGEAMGKAGAYAIQESADRFVTKLEGPYDNVVGLPVDAVRALLSEVEWGGDA